jgi:hypothetical protein
MAYGFQIYNSSGELILDSNTRITNVIVSGSTTITVPSTSPFIANSANIDFPGLTPTNDSEYSFWSASNPTITNGSTVLTAIFFYRFTDKFRIEYRAVTAGASVTVNYMGIRY